MLPNRVLLKLERYVALSDSDRETVDAHMGRVEHLDARQELMADGVGPPYVNFILEGWACRYKELGDGRRQIISFFLPGDICDPVVFLFKQMRHAFASITPITVARLTPDEMNAVISSSPALERAFWLDMLVGSEIQREWTISLGRKTAIERLAHLFCELMLRLKSVGLSDGKQCDMPLTLTDMSNVLGLSAVHVSRTLQELRSQGLMQLKHRKLIIHDSKELRKLALFDPSYLHLSPNVASREFSSRSIG